MTASEPSSNGSQEQQPAPQGPQPLSGPQEGRWQRYTGNALIALAFIVALGVGANLLPSAYDVGRATGGLVVALAVIALLEWLAMRRRDARAKGWARLAVGVLMCLLTLNGLGNMVREKTAIRAFMQGALDMQKAGEQRAAEFNARFSRIDLTQIVSPEIIADPGRQADARKRLAEFRALLAERARLTQASFAEAEQYFRTHSPSASVRDGALKTFLPRKEATLAQVAKLNAAYGALADVYQETLDWAAAQAGRVRIQDGKLQLADPAQHPVVHALAQRAAEAQARCTQAEQEARAFEAAQRDKARQNQQQAQELMGK